MIGLASGRVNEKRPVPVRVQRPRPSGQRDWPKPAFAGAFDVGRSVRRDTAPDGPEVFADVDCVMWPKHPDAPESTAFLLDLYGDHLQEAFPARMENDDWRLLRRKPQQT